MVKIKSKPINTSSSSNSSSRSIWRPLRVSVFCLCSALTIYVLSLAYISILSATSFYTGEITVAGHGEVEMMPDVQKLSISIEAIPLSSKASASTTSAKKQPALNEVAQSISEFLIANGVAENDIQIVSDGFMKVSLRGESMQNAKTLADKLIEQKNNRDVDLSHIDIYVTVEDPSVEAVAEAKKEALDIAIADARVNATEIGKSMGVKLGKIINYSDQNLGGYGEGNYSDTMYPSTGLSSNSTASPNQPIKYSYDVNLTYQTK